MNTYCLSPTQLQLIKGVNKMICPECGGVVYFDGKCFVCLDCGWWDYNI